MNYPLKQILVSILLTLIAWLVFALALAWPVKLLWNWLMPVLFSLPAITFWQAAGLMVLINILFRGQFFFETKETRSNL